MSLQWSEDLPSEWEDVPEQPPETPADSVIEPMGNGVILIPTGASVEDIPTQSYLYCDDGNVAALGEQTA